MVESGVNASRSSAVEGVEAAIPARVADERNPVSGQEMSEEEAAAHAELVQEGEKKELDAWGPFGVSTPLKAGDFGTSTADA